MPRKKAEPGLDELIDAAVAVPDAVQRQRLSARARKLVKPKRAVGRPTRFNEKIAEQIIKAMSEGQTLTSTCEKLKVNPHTVYNWMRENKAFSEGYQIAKSDLAASLVDEMVNNARALTPELALTEKVRSQIYQWTASRLAPQQFSDSRRIELKGEVQHKHTHELSLDRVT